ncbi:MAG: cytochrome c oxidase subunit II [Chitinophagales bacterium]
MSATVLGIITIVLVLIILFQISKANDSIAVLKDEEKAMESSNSIHAFLFMAFLVVGLVGSFYSAYWFKEAYLPFPSSIHGEWLRSMFQWTLVVTVPVFVITHIALFYFAFKYKKDKNRKSYYYSHNNKLEIIWTVIPAVVMILLVYEGITSWLKITGPAPTEAIVVEATAQQFMWTIRYSGDDNELGVKNIRLIGDDNSVGQDWTDAANKDDFIADEIHLPIGKPVVFKLNALDVLHSFYLPHFRVKMDCVPGIPTQFWFTPTKTTAEMRATFGPDFNYELACAELCGSAHYNMRKVVVVETQEEYDAWFKEQQPIYKQLGLDKVEGKSNNNMAEEDVPVEEGQEKDISSL